MESKDLVIIGGGPGGYTCAIRASQLGRKVTLVERENLGGVCLNWGCIPTKSLLRHAKLVDDLQRAQQFGIDIKGYQINFEKIIANSRQVASKLEQGVKYLMNKNKVEVIKGQASFENESTILVEHGGEKRLIKFKDAVLAVGASPKGLPFIDIDGERVHNYRSILVNTKLPASLTIIGAGAIGLEFSYFFSSLGVRVNLIEALDRIAPLEDIEISNALQKAFENHGIRIFTKAKVESIQKTQSAVVVTMVDSSSIPQNLETDMVLIAVGVTPNTSGLELEKVGILTNRGYIAVNENYQTTLPNVYALGDCIGGPMLAHKASHEGLIVAEKIAAKQHSILDKERIPSCIYTEPQVASIGLTEEQAKAKGFNIKVQKLPLSAIGKAVATFETEGFCKVILDEKYGEILGVHMIGPEVTELISIASIAKTHEAVADTIIESVFPHPTLSEAILEAVAAAAGRPINF
ncbi:MAG: dihydrolipoyl dehydrogenase [Deltaproteobacteria bacterium]|nr:dihydrolipoyl dehydrogenase [Deltaproteobacteria bacterium]